MKLSHSGIIFFFFLSCFCLSDNINEKKEKQHLRNTSNIVTIEVLPSDEDENFELYDYLLNEIISINNIDI
ncbi:conserved Plasmodium protein, unknown function [Plasmodium gallinaceum]|uniref:Fam-c protein n=1 Tax=Plasmodium gallinaceum TaxID=5849 RepID=A0A1J1GQF0_PLAGA|nr:conserved Plasmodium protein, unknown function [Plasmodium gallinaceum]CRG94522.1 conserved Plasmodium protein, unknown function [Plasmodium gallinaceum]